MKKRKKSQEMPPTETAEDLSSSTGVNLVEASTLPENIDLESQTTSKPPRKKQKKVDTFLETQNITTVPSVASPSAPNAPSSSSSFIDSGLVHHDSSNTQETPDISEQPSVGSPSFPCLPTTCSSYILFVRKYSGHPEVSSNCWVLAMSNFGFVILITLYKKNKPFHE